MVKNYQKLAQEGRDEVRAGIWLYRDNTFLLFIAALLEGVEQKGPFYIYGL